jgi:1-acyl-sn-glycerol-3-phosphate acyltransferase
MIFLRSTLFNIYFFGMTFLFCLPGLVLRFVAPHRILNLARMWARFIVTGARVICGIRVAVDGLERIPGGSALIASQHQSAFDTVVWLTLVPRCCYVFKQELLRIPLFGPLLPLTGMIAVDRSGGASALRGLLREADRAVSERRQIVIFPEGTRAEPGAILPLQPGIVALAARTRLPVFPVVTDSGSIWGRRAFSKPPGTIHIRILEPIEPGLGRQELMKRLEAAVRQPAEKTVDKSVDSRLAGCWRAQKEGETPSISAR